MDVRQTSNYTAFLNLQGWTIEKINNKQNYVYLKKIPFLGYIAKYQRGVINRKALKDLANLQLSYRIFQTIIEPDINTSPKSLNLLLSRGYHLSKSPYSPTKTILINLKKSQKELLNNFHKDIKYAVNKQLQSPSASKIIKNPNLTIFHESWHKSVNYKRHVPNLATLSNLTNTFLSHSIILASHNNKFTNKLYHSGLIIVCSPTTAYYWYAFTNKSGRSSLSQYTLLLSAILWAKNCHYKYFDLEGIYDDRFPIKSWRGFTKFKKKFTGEEVLYPGTYVKTNWKNVF